MGPLHTFLTGATSMGFLTAGIFFLRFWYETRDRLFLLFAIAFAALAVNRSLLGLVSPGQETQPYLYLVRLVAFVVIAFAVIDKNRR